MRVASVNAGRAEPILHRGRTFLTGICKRPVAGAVEITEEGVAGDVICDREHHGGADQAVYGYSAEDYAWWSAELGDRLEPGTFGENLTIGGLPSALHVGDRLLIGEVLLEATAPRIPCSTLAARMQDANFGLAFRRAERPGIYFRVLNAGLLAAGDRVTLLEHPGATVSTLELFRLAYERHPDPADLRRCLAAPIAARVRASVRKKFGVGAA